jgi:hypothetical protein
MVIKIIENQKTINLAQEIIPQDFENRTTETSYLNEFKIKDGKVNFNSDFLYRLICYSNLKKEIENEYQSNLDIFGGVGITAKIYSKEKTYVNEIDKDLLVHLKNNFDPQNVYNQDAFNFERPQDHTYDLILADYNDFTLLKTERDPKYFNSLMKLGLNTERFLIINDCSVFHLKYGPKSFQNYSNFFQHTVNNYEQYHQQAIKYYRDRYGLIVRRVEWFSNSSFILFDRKWNSDPKINRLTDKKQPIIQIL